MAVGLPSLGKNKNIQTPVDLNFWLNKTRGGLGAPTASQGNLTTGPCVCHVPREKLEGRGRMRVAVQNACQANINPISVKRHVYSVCPESVVAPTKTNEVIATSAATASTKTKRACRPVNRARKDVNPRQTAARHALTVWQENSKQ